MTRLTRRELFIGGTAIVAAGTLPGTAFAEETAGHPGFSKDTNTKGEHSMTTITTKDGTTIYSRVEHIRTRKRPKLPLQSPCENPGCPAVSSAKAVPGS